MATAQAQDNNDCPHNTCALFPAGRGDTRLAGIAAAVGVILVITWALAAVATH